MDSFHRRFNGKSHHGQVPAIFHRHGKLTMAQADREELLRAENQTTHSRMTVLNQPNEDTAQIARYVYDCVLELHITDQVSLDLLARALPDILETFALRLFYSNQHLFEQRDFASVLHNERRPVVVLFEELCATRLGKDSSPRPQPSRPSFLSFLRSSFFEGAREDTLPGRTDRIRSTNDGKRRNECFSEQPDGRYKQQLSNFPGVLRLPCWRDWLKGMMRRSICCDPLDSARATILRRAILKHLSNDVTTSAEVCPSSTELVVAVDFVVHWDPRLLVEEWAHDEIDIITILGRIITLTGSRDVQAATCEQYVLQTWPETGEQALGLIAKAIKGWSAHGASAVEKEQYFGELDGFVFLEYSFTAAKLLIRAEGSPYLVSELSEQIGWIVSALQSSPYSSEIATIYPVLHTRMLGEPLLRSSAMLGHRARQVALRANMHFVTERYLNHQSPRNGQCWHKLFKNPVVVTGYPVQVRPPLEPGTGLEIPLDVLMALVDSTGIEKFNEMNLIKGFSAILVPTRKVQDIVLWHMWYNENHERISYTDARIGEFEYVTEAELNSSRHIVGWCSRAQNHTGSPNANYDIKWSGLGCPRDRHVWEKVVVSAGSENAITVSTAFVLSKKDKSIVSSPLQGYRSRLTSMSKQYVLLYDVADRRAWLVDGLSALLHLVRASLKSEHSAIPGVLSHHMKQIKEADPCLQGAEAAASVLLNADNCATQLYLDEEELWEEEVETRNSRGETVREMFAKKKKKFYCFRDRVLDIYSLMEKLVDHLSDLRSENGVGFRFRGTPRNLLQGFDFQDLATCQTPLRPHTVKLSLQNSGRGWIDLARSLQAITLFGKDFGDLITPKNPPFVQGCDGCGFGTSLPKNKDYMGVCVNLLERIINARGSIDSVPWKLTDDIYWHTPGQVFESCQCRKGGIFNHTRKTDRAQVLLPSKTPHIWARSFNIPGSFESGGAVYFCQVWKFPFRLSHQMELRPLPQDANIGAQADGATKATISVPALPLEKCRNKETGAHGGPEDIMS